MTSHKISYAILKNINRLSEYSFEMINPSGVEAGLFW